MMQVSTLRGLTVFALALTAGVLVSTIVNVHIRLAGSPGEMHPAFTYVFAAAFGLIGLIVLISVHALFGRYFAYQTESHWTVAGLLYSGTWAAFIFGQFWLAFAFAFAPLILRLARAMPWRTV